MLEKDVYLFVILLSFIIVMFLLIFLYCRKNRSEMLLQEAVLEHEKAKLDTIKANIILLQAQDSVNFVNAKSDLINIKSELEEEKSELEQEKKMYDLMLLNNAREESIQRFYDAKQVENNAFMAIQMLQNEKKDRTYIQQENNIDVPIRINTSTRSIPTVPINTSNPKSVSNRPTVPIKTINTTYVSSRPIPTTTTVPIKTINTTSVSSRPIPIPTTTTTVPIKTINATSVSSRPIPIPTTTTTVPIKTINPTIRPIISKISNRPPVTNTIESKLTPSKIATFISPPPKITPNIVNMTLK
jgi:hypothetical protein